MKKLFTLAAAVIASMGMWAQTVTMDLALAKNSTPAPSVGEALLSGGAFDGTGYKMGTDGNFVGWNVAATKMAITAVSFNGYINTNNTDKNWGIQFSTDGGDTWEEELSQANDGTKSYHDITVTVEIPNGANAVRLIRRAGTSTFVASITLTLGEAAPAVTYTVTYKANNGTDEKDSVNTAAQKVADNMFTAPEGYVFAGWNTAADGTGTAYKVGTKLDSNLTLYAQWEVITTCTYLVPATSGDALNVGDEVVLNTVSEGGQIFVAGMKTAGSSISYNPNGLQLGGGGADSIRVELFNYLKEGSIITLQLMSVGGGDGKDRGLKLLTLGKKEILNASWAAEASGEVKTFTYTVTATDGLAGQNKFLLQRNNSTILQVLSVANCGEAVPGIVIDDTPTLSVSKTSVDLALTAAQPSMQATITFSGKYLTPGTYNLVVPEVAGMTVSPTSMTVAENGTLSQVVTISYTSAVDVTAASAEISLTVGELNAKVAINYSAVMAKNYINHSIFIDQLVLDYGTKYDVKADLTKYGWEYANLNELDTLNDLENKTNRNVAFLGLKLKTAGAYIAGWIKAGDGINIKFGNIGSDIKVSIKGATTDAEQTFTAADLAEWDNEFPIYDYTEDVYVKFSTVSGGTVVLKQIIKIEDEFIDVILPAPGAYMVNVAEAENGKVEATWADKKYRAPVGATVTLNVTPAEGYKVATVTLDGEALTAVEGVYSFEMPAKDVTVAATFVAESGTSITNTEAAVKAVKVVREGKLFIEKNGVLYNAQGNVVK